MPPTPPHIDAELVRRLISAQFPEWAHLPVVPVVPGGWDNRTFRLGDSLTVRLPSAVGYVPQVEKEHHWLPVLAQQLPLPIPTPVGLGEPGDNYPWPWSVYEWIDGTPATQEPILDLPRFAGDVAEFLIALQRIDATDGPLPGAHNYFRGAPPEVYDAEARQAIDTLGDSIDADGATSVWEAALTTQWQHSPVWFHGDISTGNLLLRDGRLSAVIDFGTCGVGDPACDLAISWITFDEVSRDVFRSTLNLDDGTWARARGWTIWKALIVAAGSAGTHSPRTEALAARRVIDRVIADHRR
jgi:aminoglycoside phosphotransferase (APT) family kinase protein